MIMAKPAAAVVWWLAMVFILVAAAASSVGAEEPASTSSCDAAGEGGGGGGGGGDGDGDGTCKVGAPKKHSHSHGWLRYDSTFDGPCTIDRVRASEISFRSFTAHYKNKKPVVLTGMRERNEKFRALSARARLLRDWGDKPIVLSTANTHSYDKHVKTLREYATHHMQPQRLDVSGDKTLYWFGDNNHTEWAAHFDEQPPFIPSSAAVALSFGVGGPHSGVPLHIHGPGFSETIVGRKRWWLSPPKPKPKFNPNATALEWALGLKKIGGGGGSAAGNSGDEDGRLQVEVADDDAEWVHTPKHYLEEERAKRKTNSEVRPDGSGGDNGGGGAEMFECTVGEGEAVYFPDGW